MKTFEIPMLSMSFLGLCLLSGLDAPPARADLTFGELVNIESIIPVLDAMSDAINCFSSDGLEMYIMRENLPEGYGGFDLWVLRRESKEEDWGPPENLGPEINSDKNDGNASISVDGLTLYIETKRSGGYGGYDIWMTTRTTREAPWGKPMNLGPKINTSVGDASPWISADGLELFFTSFRSEGYGRGDIYVVRRETTEDPWDEPENLGPVVNSEYTEVFPCLSPDGLLMIFSTGMLDEPPRPGGYGGCDMWMTRRARLSDPWQPPVNLGPRVNRSVHEMGPRLSPDGSTLYFYTNSGGNWDNWQTSIEPICDFNGDGVVDIVDVGIMIEHWYTDYSLCDIGPVPWGDGFVDAEDLKVLAEHLCEGPRPTAHWKLDEDQGDIAYDSAGIHDADLCGEPVWQPTSGKDGGALQLDGTNDYISTPFILDPAEGSFSVFAWIKGGDSGRSIVCQGDRTGFCHRWLGADASQGRLMTRLMHPPFAPLMSQSVITDGQWHHVGLVYDCIGLHRGLYVDGVEVVSDTDCVGGVFCQGGLTIGAGEALDPSAFWPGLIDDVRIYDVALSTEEIAALAR